MECNKTIPNNNLKLFYLDQSGKVQEDHDSSFIGKVSRIVSSVLGLIDYNIIRILPKMTTLTETNQEYLTSKEAKHFGISSNQLKQIQRISAYYLDNKAISNKDQKDVKSFLETSVGDLNSTLQLFRAEGLEIFILGGVI